MKEPYETPTLEIIEFEEEDIILASSTDPLEDCSTDCSIDCTDE